MLLSVCLGLHAQPLPASVRGQVEADPFKNVPAPWREYLLQARRAEDIADPLQRCLAYPDLPGNRWPPGHARAHCLDHTVQAMSMEDARKLLETGRVGELEAYLRRLEAEHARPIDPSEELHYFFEQFESEDADEFTAAWLAAQPDSPYALTARAHFHSGAAMRARGGAWAWKTPPEAMRRMTAEYDLALPLYRKAVRLAPRFVEPWDGMLELAYRDSREELEKEAFKAASAIEPGCRNLAKIRMASLEPRWGGSYEAMLAYAEQLKPLLATRPLLASQIAAPFGDRGNMLISSKELGREAMDVLDVAVRTGSNEDYLEDAANVAFNAEDGARDEWKALGYLLQVVRFREGGWWVNVNIARMLVDLEPSMARRYAALAVADEPEKAAGHYYLAVSSLYTKRFDEADKHYQLAMQDSDYLHSSLDEVVRMWMFEAGLSPKEGGLRARPYIERLVREFPDDGRGYMYRILSEGAITGKVPEQWIADFEQRADLNDHRQAGFLRWLQEMRKSASLRIVLPSASHEAGRQKQSMRDVDGVPGGKRSK
ncbi:MAG: hypothetical protein K6T33_05475 [Thermomonas hydrothermalis]|uniref:hypothetical protein n=1 Tax=Thermomonas hydrothermalis TaxID=213588 RepID=UPI002354B506|nr:hypothetical protein [Thermomonas hydrothermalis]MCL6619221.1 hypothetical protein [Thermomonas hydrothermalis]